MNQKPFAEKFCSDKMDSLYRNIYQKCLWFFVCSFSFPKYLFDLFVFLIIFIFYFTLFALWSFLVLFFRQQALVSIFFSSQSEYHFWHSKYLRTFGWKIMKNWNCLAHLKPCCSSSSVRKFNLSSIFKKLGNFFPNIFCLYV